MCFDGNFFKVKLRPIHIAIHILFSIFIEEKWTVPVVNVSHVNECVKMYKDYIGVFPVRNYCVWHAQNTIKLLWQQKDTQWFP
jgi:hypothetical protein